MLDKDGMYSVIDSVCDQPIFFLISQTEDFPELKRLSSSQDNCDDESIANQLKSLNVDGSEEEKKKPFTFSDFMSLTADANDEIDVNEKDQTQDECIANEDDKSGLDDDVESVYMMASSRSIDCVVEEYMKRKKSCTMLPTTSHFAKRKHSFAVYNGNVGVMEPLPPEIEQQRKSSINKVSIDCSMCISSENMSILMAKYQNQSLHENLFCSRVRVE